jgi:glutamyl-tRNA(Gln) amidotransferase subunit D
MKHVKLTLENEHLEGILVKEDDKHVVLKLSSGYNIGIKKNKILKIEDIESYDELIKERHSEKVHKEIVQGGDSGLPNILILHTGGTIASKVDYKTGAVTPKFSPEELTGMFPEIKELAHIESKLFRNMASDDMRFAHYNLIAKEVEKELHEHKNMHSDLKGIIITHGTDTLHYTSVALSFIFENLPIPIVLVGSQRSSDRGSSDSAMNLISAVAFITNTSLKGVFICMHESMSDDACTILNGINSRKMHSSRRDAFKQINGEPIARVDYMTKTVEYLNDYPESSLNASGQLKLYLFDEALKIGIVQSHPNMFAEELEYYKKGFDGLILEGTGLGHFPITEDDEYTKEHAEIRKVLGELCRKIPVIMSLQTINGSVNMNVYSPGRDMIAMGVIGNYSSLTPESSFIKLAWLLSQKLDPKEYFMKSLRGEFSSKQSE